MSLEFRCSVEVKKDGDMSCTSQASVYQTTLDGGRALVARIQDNYNIADYRSTLIRSIGGHITFSEAYDGPMTGYHTVDYRDDGHNTVARLHFLHSLRLVYLEYAKQFYRVTMDVSGIRVYDSEPGAGIDPLFFHQLASISRASWTADRMEFAGLIARTLPVPLCMVIFSLIFTVDFERLFQPVLEQRPCPDSYGETCWVCRACQAGNPMSLDVCSVCGEPRSW